MLRIAIALVVFRAVLISTAAAHPLVDAITRHDEADINTLRGSSDPSARCTLGAVYLLRDDLTRAAIYLEGCDTKQLAPQIAGWIALAMRALPDRLAFSDLGSLEITTLPTGLVVTVDASPGDALSGERFTAPAKLWLPEDGYVVRAGHKSLHLSALRRSRTRATLDLRPTGETLWPDPGRNPHPSVMHANDCTIARLREPGHRCRLLEDRIDLDDLRTYSPLTVMNQYRPTIRLVRDLEVPIIATAESL